ncbi:MAG TPA: hypothetical protein VGL42_00090 [Opitutaceae bacterium]|jgi:hypothetical protein
MRAFAFSLFLLIYWTLVGRALFCLCRDRPGILRSWLLAPSLGLAVTVLTLAAGNQAGMPIGQFAWPMTLILLAGSLLVLGRHRPTLPGPAALPFAGAAVLFVAWAGWPFFKYGFHWTALVNDDYLNYCLAAERFRNFGFYRVPKLEELLGKDCTQFYWFMHVPQLMRFGGEQIVAWSASLAGLRAVLAFMPAIVALGSVQLLAAAGLVLHRGRWRKAAQGAAVLLAIAPMFMFGALYQLIAQVGGLPLMLTFIALGTRRMGSRRGWGLATWAISAAVAGSAMALFYPEVSPFGWLGIAIFLAIEVVQRRGVSGARVGYWAWIVVLAVFFMRDNLFSYGYTLWQQAAHGLSHSSLTDAVFPFFLIPSGMPMLFGLQGISGFPSEPWGSLLIVAGALVLLGVGFTCCRLVWRGEPFGCLLLIELAMGVSLFRHANDFGLYKLAMYIQPTALGALAWWFAGRRSNLRRVLAAGFVAFNLAVGLRYVQGTAGGGGPVTNELNGASVRVTHMPPLKPPGGVWAAGFDNVGAAKFAAERYRGSDLRFLDHYYFKSLTSVRLDQNSPLMWLNPHRNLYPVAEQLLDEVRAALDRKASLFGTTFVNADLPPDVSGYLVFPGQSGLFNKAPLPPPDPGTLFGQAAPDTPNLACFVNSSEGALYYLPDSRDLAQIGLYQREPDGFDGQGGIYALGRFLLLRIQNPSDTVYVRVLASKSSKGRNRTHWNGQGVVMGKETVPLTFVGDGSGNVYAGPVHPVQLGRACYIALDFRETPTRVNFVRTGLNRLFHDAVPMDYRQIIGFGRDISVLSPQEYAALVAPQELDSAEQLLTDPGLKYSGLFEDGWASGTAYIELAGAQPKQALRVQGYAPDIGGHIQRFHLSVNGRPLPVVDFAPGPIDWLIPVPANAASTRFDLRSEVPAIIPGIDGRPVSLWLQSVGLVDMPVRYDFVHANGPRPFEPGVDTDGWTGRKAELLLPSGDARHLKLELLFPNWGQLPDQGDVTVSVDGGAAESHLLKAGTTVIELPILPGRGGHTVRLVSSTELMLPAPDHRTRSYQLLSAEFLP